jgi:2,4-didehydro-3-deoxy-L-rhamnonate hydrolase
VSERAFQLQSSQWDKGKGCDTFGPIGPWLVTTDEITNPQTLDVWLDVNGERRQSSNTRNMIFSCAKLVSYVSNYMTLLPGDIITTGTPAGVALGMKPTQAWLKPGDVVTLGIKGLGEQRQKVISYTSK